MRMEKDANEVDQMIGFPIPPSSLDDFQGFLFLLIFFFFCRIEDPVFCSWFKLLLYIYAEFTDRERSQTEDGDWFHTELRWWILD